MSGSFGPSQNSTSSAGSINLSSPGAIGDVLPSSITSTDLTIRGRNGSVPRTAQDIFSGSNSILCNADLVLVNPASTISMVYPGIAPGMNGQVLTLHNAGAFGCSVIFDNSSGVKTNRYNSSNFELKPGYSTRLRYYAAFQLWLVDGDITDSVEFTGICKGPTTATFLVNSDEIATKNFIGNHLYSHDQPGWRNLTLTANWVNNNISSFGALAIKRIGREMVQVRGVINVSGSYSPTITTIPLDCRSSVTQNFPAFSQAGSGQLSLSPTGILVNSVVIPVGQFQVVNFTYFI